jgi:ATP-grasp domain
LTGYRGAPAANTAAVEDLLLRLGRLSEEVPEISELDLNPVVVGPHEVVLVDAKLHLAAMRAEPDAPSNSADEPEVRRRACIDRVLCGSDGDDGRGDQE